MFEKMAAKGLRTILFVCLAAAGTMIIGQTETGIARADSNPNYRIGIGDVLKITVTRQEKLSVDGVRVSNDGSIRMPMLDEDIPAACLTETELAESITSKYTKFLKEPQTYVSVTEFHPNLVALIGAVNAPGRFDIQRPTRLLELISFANGPTINAGSSVQIIRKPGAAKCAEKNAVPVPSESEEQIITVLLSETLQANESANPYLQAGDIISIAAADEPAEAYIVGNVINPSPIKLDEPTTLSKAIAMAGGVSKDAKIEKIVIHRQDPKTLAKSQISINLKDINSDKQEDILLQANDIIDVPGKKPSLLSKIFEGFVLSASRGIVRF